MSDTLEVLDGRWSFDASKCYVCGESLHGIDGDPIVDPATDRFVVVCPENDPLFGNRNCADQLYEDVLGEIDAEHVLAQFAEDEGWE